MRNPSFGIVCETDGQTGNQTHRQNLQDEHDGRITSNMRIHLLQEQQSTAHLSLNKSKTLALFLQ